MSIPQSEPGLRFGIKLGIELAERGVSEPFLPFGDQGHKVGFAPPLFDRRTPEKRPFGRPKPLRPHTPSICRKIEYLNGHALQLGTWTDKTPSPIAENPVPADPPVGAIRRSPASVGIAPARLARVLFSPLQLLAHWTISQRTVHAILANKPQVLRRDKLLPARNGAIGTLT